MRAGQRGSAIQDPEPSPGSRFAAVLREAADRFAEDLSGCLGMTVSVTSGEAEGGSAGGLLSQIGEVVVAMERPVTGAAAGTLLGLCSGADAAWLAALVAGTPETAADQRTAGFVPDQHRDLVGKVLDGVLQTAVSVLAEQVEVTAEEVAGQAKVFALDQDLNRAVSFLGEGELSAAKLAVSAGDAGTAAVWILARPSLAEALESRPPGARQAPTPQRRVKDLLRISVPVIVTLAEKEMPLDEILGLSVGQVIDFDKPCDEFLDLMVNNRCIGHGEVVRVGERFGLRIVEIGDVKDTLRKLGQFGSA